MCGFIIQLGRRIMRLDLITIIIPAITILTIGLIATMIGISGSIHKKAVIIRNLYYYGPYQLVLLSFLYFPLQFLFTENSDNLVGQALLVSMCLLTAIVFIVFRFLRYRKNFFGYTIIGVDKSILEAITYALKLNGIPFEEAHEDFWLSEPHSQITTSFPPLIGTVNIGIDPWSLHTVLDSLMGAMKSHIEEKEYYYDDFSMTRFTFFGLFLSAFGLITTIVAMGKI
jgi:hypothetical protein